MIDAAACIRHRQDVDQCARGIRNAHTHRATPNRLESEEACACQVVHDEMRSLCADALSRDTPGREDQRFVEQLLGEIPVVSGRPTVASASC
jgi:hypothetical protein